MWGIRSSRTLLIGAAAGAFVALSVLPFAYMLVHAASVGASSTALVLDARQRGLLYQTTLLGAGTAIVATLIGAPLGLALARIALPFKPVLRIALGAPVVLPPYVVGLAWIYLGSRIPVSAPSTGREVIAGWIYSLPAAIAVLSLVLYPLSMLATEVALRRIEPRLEEAALVVAAPRRVLRQITLPLAAPSIVAAALVIFVLAVSEFGVPALLRVRVFTTEVFTAFAALYDFGRATLLSLPLLGLSLVVAALAAVLVGQRFITTRRAMAGVAPTGFEAGQPFAIAAVVAVVGAALVLPLLVLVREALGIRSFAEVIGGSRDAIVNSLRLAALGATTVTLIAVWLGYARARLPTRCGVVADVICVVLFAVPPTIVGVGLIGLWNRGGVFGRIYGTDGMLLLAYLARFLPVAALGLAAGIRHVPTSHEEAAAAAGAGWWRTMLHIVLPQTKLSVLATWTVVFILAFGELGASILVAPPGEATLPIRIYTIIANTPASHVAALALLQSIVVLVPLMLLGAAVAGRRGR